MPGEDAVGLLIFVAMTAAAIGGTVVVCALRTGSARRERDLRFREAAARWLAARAQVCRAAAMLIEAHQAVDAEFGHSPRYSTLQDEVLRARYEWCESILTLGHARARLLVWCRLENSRELARLPHAGEEALVFVRDRARDREYLERLSRCEVHVGEQLVRVIQDETTTPFVRRLGQALTLMRTFAAGLSK